MKKDKIVIGIFCVVLVLCFVLQGFSHKSVTPKSVYQVYLNGERIGLVDNKEELLNLINEEQQDIRDTYSVSQVYPPNGFDIEEYITYDENVVSANNIYQKIKEQSDFTVEGYVVTITSPKTENEEEKVTKIYVLDENVYKEAEKRFVLTFVDEKDFNAYITNSQEAIRDVGSIIKHMEFGESISIKKAYISTKEKIFTNASELTQYLLYGTTEPNEGYVVKQGDTIASIAEESKLNVRELLIANPRFKSENAILAIGDKVSNSIINPILTLYQELRVTEDVEQAFTKKTVVDNSMRYNTSKVTQNGVTGLARITQELRVVNGERTQDTNLISSVTIREAVEEITSVGPSYSANPNGWTGGNGYGGTIHTGLDWGWPTKTPYVITTNYEWRWGSFHNALDISGTGFGSPIYVARGGTVVETFSSCANYGYLGSLCGGSYGNYIVVQHENNYYTMYAHLKTDLQVGVGSKVSRGQVIGFMGSSGSSTGTHLHFGFSVGQPHHGGRWYNPWSLYR